MPHAAPEPYLLSRATPTAPRAWLPLHGSKLARRRPSHHAKLARHRRRRPQLAAPRQFVCSIRTKNHRP
uniref:Uncharacterized protein n=1 Tax=Triticum urartu TaxID=4572 RepID=A0A8R7UXG1_TRIUA